MDAIDQTPGLTHRGKYIAEQTMMRSQLTDCERIIAALVVLLGGEVEVPDALLTDRTELVRLENPARHAVVLKARLVR